MRSAFILVCLVFVAAPACADHQAKVTVNVVDEEGAPIEGAEVRVFFDAPLSSGGAGQKVIKGFTDSEGLFTGGGTVGGYATYDARKVGYYISGGPHPFVFDSWDRLSNRWQPWNPMGTIVLRRVENPVPMYAKVLRGLILPVLDVPVGYDLEVGDWVIPHGKGTVADFFFTVHKNVVSQKNFDSSLELTFSRPGDGIQEVLWPKEQGGGYLLPRYAPEAGYLDRLFLRMRWLPGQRLERDFREDRNYFFRVRTVLDEHGNVVHALYGKIQGDIKFGVVGGETAGVTFTYYLNPDGTRNMEFDPKRNLLRGLTRLEEVRAP